MGAAGAAFVGANTVRFSSLPLLDDAYFDMLDNEIFAAIADAVLLPHCGSYWVNTGQIMYIGPGEAAQVLHRDADNGGSTCAQPGPTWSTSRSAP